MPDESLEDQYRKVRDREPLKALANGLMIVRCKKHEPIVLTDLSREQVIWRTSKQWGSKFTSDWTLAKYVQWIELRLKELRWSTATGPTADNTIFPDPVGISRGIPVHTIKLISDRRFVHAYPDEDTNA
jgi:hypothetical protein